MGTKCPSCKSDSGFEISIEKVKQPDGKIDGVSFVRCASCKTAINALDREVNSRIGNAILTTIQKIPQTR